MVSNLTPPGGSRPIHHRVTPTWKATNGPIVTSLLPLTPLLHTYTYTPRLWGGHNKGPATRKGTMAIVPFYLLLPICLPTRPTQAFHAMVGKLMILRPPPDGSKVSIVKFYNLASIFGEKCIINAIK